MMSKGKVLVTPRSLSKEMHPALQPLADLGYELLTPWPGRQPSEEELLEMLPGCIGYLAGVEPISERVLSAAEGLKVISRNGVGINNIDLGAAEKLGIRVMGTPGANAQGVAELAVGLILSSMRSLSWSSSRMKQGGWDRKKGKEILGRTLGIIGCGQIGQRVARMTVGLGMKVLGTDIFQDPSLAAMAGFSFTDINGILQNSDVISLHCPPSAFPIINSQAIDLMKDGVCLVNTARADLVDEQALYGALLSGRVAHYASDVFLKEPPEMTDLFLHDAVTVTPHIGGFTDESVERAARAAAVNLLQVLTEQEKTV